jgi:glyoxylase-like metal-dependent hydrolase (beta-lactamase superfamily II)
MPAPQSELTIKKLSDNIWDFNEGFNGNPGVDAYLITGSKRAAVIDTLAGGNLPMYEKVRELTSLPIDVLVTHGHGDHAGAAAHAFHKAGCDLYMNSRDHGILGFDLKPEMFKPLEEGMVFDLGGFRLETIQLFGHTAGQVVFLDREKHLLFTGDGTGAGVFWMQLPNSLPMREFHKNLLRLWDNVKDMKDLKLHPGHRNQAPVQLGLEFLADTIYVTEKIISREMVGDDRELDFAGQHINYKRVSYKLITDYCYRPENI